MNVSLEINSLLSVHGAAVLYILLTCERMVLTNVGYPDDMQFEVNGTAVEDWSLTI
jgi:hypothetical protein